VAGQSAGGPTSLGGKRVTVVFFRTEAGGEPVRRWLKSLPYDEDRKRIGADIKTAEFGWPLGMPVCRPLGDGIYEIRTHLTQNRIARVLFYVDRQQRMVLLHGFIKKTQKRPTRIWNWLGRTRASINREKDEKESNERPQRLYL
jgi:phage-related protein